MAKTLENLFIDMTDESEYSEPIEQEPITDVMAVVENVHELRYETDFGELVFDVTNNRIRYGKAEFVPDDLKHLPEGHVLTKMEHELMLEHGAVPVAKGQFKPVPTVPNVGGLRDRVAKMEPNATVTEYQSLEDLFNA